MQDEKADEIIKKKLDAFLSSGRLRKIIEEFQNENPPGFKIKAKGKERAHEITERIKSQSNRLDELCHEYLQATEQVKKNGRLSTEDKLKKLISPLREIQKILLPDYLEYHQFINDTYIGLRKELDWDNLTPNHRKYSIVEDTELRELGLLHTNHKIISLNLGLKSIVEIWPDWLKTLDQKTMASKDRLTQILVCYTIKRALNGDDVAAKKLYDLYKDAAEGLAVNTAKKFGLYNTIMLEEMKENAKYDLSLIIKGFRPEDILRELLLEKKTIERFPPWIRRFYVNHLTEYIPPKIREIQKKVGQIDKIIVFGNALSSGQISTEELEKKFETQKEVMETIRNMNVKEAIKELKESKASLGLELKVLLNPYTPIHQGTRAKVTPIRENRFNSYSYLPIKMGSGSNLTTWLFGFSDKDPRARLYRLLRDKYLPETKKRFKEKSLDKKHKETIKSRDKPVDEMIEEKEEIKRLKKEINRVKKELLNLGVSHRDIDLYFQWKGGKKTQSKIAQEYCLSERHIRRICQQIKELIPKVKPPVLEE